MSRFTSLKSVFLKHKFQLIITYTLFGLEMLGTLLRPYFLGKAMDDIFEGSYKGLIVLASTHLAWLI
ncbi:MAG: hypothetical protein JNJ85_06630, partial [Candidatus Kapabacteria bacterium]|nr:hypothetical protein [Candidatus Kapabacteria bacterium]